MSLFVMTACDDTTDTVGASLTDEMDHLTVLTDTFEISSRSVKAGSVYARSAIGYLGKIKDPETGSYVSGSFMGQFHTLENHEFPEASYFKNGEIKADSCHIRLFYRSYFGDSLAVMRLSANEIKLEKPMEENQQYHSDYDPEKEGHVREDGIHEKKSYTLIDLAANDRNTSNYTNNICIRFNDEYTDDKGNTYNNYGTYLMKKFYEDKNNYKNTYNFIHNVCPGFYFKTESGIGNMAYVIASQLNIYYTVVVDGKEHVNSASFSGTEEVMQHTFISNDEAKINELVNDETCTYIKTPSGIFTELELPIDDVMKGHENDTINTARFALSRVNNDSYSKYTLAIPKSLLLVPTDSLDSFFANAKLIDYKKTYYAAYSSTSNNYTFNNISTLLTSLFKAKTEGLAKDANWLNNHPNWNKVTIVPVTIETSTQGSFSKISHDLSLGSTRLAGGEKNAYGPIKLSVIYSKFE